MRGFVCFLGWWSSTTFQLSVSVSSESLASLPRQLSLEVCSFRLSGFGLGPHGAWGGLGENRRFPVTPVHGLLLSPSSLESCGVGRFPLAGLPWIPPCCA